ncbi:DNA-3-methyladenine glycosylase [Pseudobacillus badius]|uniref:DNA-3-methyladenine glycosylase n=2 Tax=Bacillus badius TaxID=1455 RepID=UPI0007B0BCE5|nr:DNA-3-methyladenine glycosylase [Bacillus badius]KZN98157.1 3-methyladenine DNA glycosylase [Bacillus badius]MED0665426.1 DNA-3-methyladenine glycosylase [Bacillus badius]OCS82420.1 3-methyladenine DNA glycosylase [Bacillus badius]OVE50934.1 3-methyladenine DNA glycosylase [Bacillus badius]TDW01736.1 DNA-3-methyladenine glycosylase [Bacillus badius]
MEQKSPFMPVDKSFFQQPTLQLAEALLGCLLVKETEEGTAAGFIVETEAYRGPMDRAAHSFNNRRTKRTEIMFHEAGRVYTYVMHTHCLVNVVSAESGIPEAVLIRAVEPYEGVDLMIERRGGTSLKNLTSGPGKLTKALGITMEDYGRRFDEPPLYIVRGFTPKDISAGPRIGIDNSGEAKEYPWRFWVTGNAFVSR